MHFTTLDTETFLIEPARLAPRPVSLAIDVRQDELLHFGYDREAARERAYYAFQGRPVGANLAYDAAVILADMPELGDIIWDCYDGLRAYDIQVAEKLIDLSRGRLGFTITPEGFKKARYNLGEIVFRRFGRQMQKDGGWRLKYGTLYGTPVPQWPEDARRYASDDLCETRAVMHAQLQEPPQCLVDVARQTRHAWWLYLMTARGFLTSRERVLRLEEEIAKEMQEIGQRLRGAGLLSLAGVRDTKAAGAYMTRVLAMQGRKPVLTADEKVELTEEQCTDSGDPLLVDYARYSGRVTMLAKVRALKDAAVAGKPIQSRFEVLLETGRTSCSGGRAKKKDDIANRTAFEFQLQNLPREIGLRECFIPRPGYVLGSLDYGQLELCTWAQVCMFLFGYSRLGEALNAGKDVHCMLGGRIVGRAYEEVLANRKKETWAKDARQNAKVPNFSLPGGMGVGGLMRVAKQQYSLIWTEDQAREIYQAWKQEWPENKDYFAFIRRCVGESFGSKGTIVQLQSQRVRGGVGFTDGSNGYFQSLAADLAKAAMYECARACYTGRDSRGQRYPALLGSYLVDFVHDEGLFEFIADRAHEAAYEASDIMRRVAKEWCPDVTPGVEPALMRVWSKDAAPEYDNGRLVPWTPKEAA